MLLSMLNKLNVILLLFCACFLASGTSANAQIGGANLRGVVTDSSGALIPGASVVLRNTGTGTIRSATTGPSGEYTIPSLVPGDYTLRIQFQGFKEFVISSMTLHTGEEATVNAKLVLGTTTEQVIVTSEDPMLNTTSSTVQSLIAPTAVAHLPLNGRQFWQLAQLTPGSTYIPRAQSAQYNGSEIRARAVNVNTNGQSSIFTGWMLDGALVTNMELGGTLIQPNVDAIQEFNVKAGNMSAAYGYSPNMVVASLKTGDNGFHGDVFEYLRNDAFDAANYFVPTKLSLKQNQFGFTLGGPVVRNRIFFFVDYQGTRLVTGTPFNVVVPSAAQRTGDYSGIKTPIKNPLTGQPYPGNIIPPAQISSQAQFLLKYMPLPTTTQGTTSRFQYGPSTPLNNDEGDAKIDVNLTKSDFLMARYSINQNNELDPLPFPELGEPSLTSWAQDGTARWTHVFNSSLLNVAQAAIYRSPFVFGAVLGGTDIDGMAGISGFSNPALVPLESFPLINIAGYQGFQGSPSDQRPKAIQARDWQYSDSVHYTKGKHAMDLGMEWLRRVDTFGGPGGGNSVGTFSFLSTYTGDAFSDFLLGYPASASRGAYLPLQGDYDNFPAWYFDDVYQPRQGLTLNFGLRYQVDPWFKGVNYATSAFDPSLAKEILPIGLQSHPNAAPLVASLTPLFSDRILYSSALGLPAELHPTSHDWNPRVGIAFSPFGSQTWAIRSGYGIYYVFPDTNLTNNTKNVVPLQDSQSVNNSTPTPTLTFGNFFLTPIGSANPNPGQPCSFGLVMLSCETPSVTGELVHLKQQYVQEWNLSVQDQIAKGVSVTIAYVGNKTDHLQQSISTNLPSPGPGNIQLRRPLPQWGPIGLQEWGGNANYNALQAQIEARNWRSLTLIGTYTKSKCLDNGSDESGPPAPELASLMYGPCNFDLPQTASISYDYVLPFGNGQQFLNSGSSFINSALGGWRLGGIVTLQSGMPFTPTISTDTANTGASGERPELIGKPRVIGNIGCWFNVSANSACTSLNAPGAFALPAQYTYGNSGRNILRSGSLKEWDASLMKNFKIWENVNLLFRAEYFNVLNHPTFGAPVTNTNVASGGQVSSTLNSNRIGQFALKLSF